LLKASYKVTVPLKELPVVVDAGIDKTKLVGPDGTTVIS